MLRIDGFYNMVGIQQIAKYGRLFGLASCGIFRLCAISVLRPLVAQVVGDQSQPKPQLVRPKSMAAQPASTAPHAFLDPFVRRHRLVVGAHHYSLSASMR